MMNPRNKSGDDNPLKFLKHPPILALRCSAKRCLEGRDQTPCFEALPSAMHLSMRMSTLL
jgi:hypothetical protein